jgi:hypothetical protein
MLSNAQSVEQFALLYEELKEFEDIDARFVRLNEATIKQMLTYAQENLNEFVKLKKGETKT